MATLIPMLVATTISTIATTAIQSVLAPDIPDPPVLLDDESNRLGNAADQESARRRAASPQPINTTGVGAPGVNVGSPTVVLGG